MADQLQLQISLELVALAEQSNWPILRKMIKSISRSVASLIFAFKRFGNENFRLWDGRCRIGTEEENDQLISGIRAF